MISPRVDALQSLREYAQETYPEGGFSIEVRTISTGYGKPVQARYCVALWVFGEADHGEDDKVHYSPVCKTILEAAESIREELCCV